MGGGGGGHMRRGEFGRPKEAVKKLPLANCAMCNVSSPTFFVDDDDYDDDDDGNDDDDNYDVNDNDDDDANDIDDDYQSLTCES